MQKALALVHHREKTVDRRERHLHYDVIVADHTICHVSLLFASQQQLRQFNANAEMDVTTKITDSA